MAIPKFKQELLVADKIPGNPPTPIVYAAVLVATEYIPANADPIIPATSG